MATARHAETPEERALRIAVMRGVEPAPEG
jgi:hypothetical protein